MTTPSIHSVPSDLFGIIVWAIGLIILWVIVSIPVYFAGRVVTSGKSTFGQAMGATLGGALAYFIVYFMVSIFLGAALGSPAAAFALILGLVVWLAVYRAVFDTGWLGAIGIVLVGWVILLVLDFFLVLLFGVRFPDFFPF